MLAHAVTLLKVVADGVPPAIVVLPAGFPSITNSSVPVPTDKLRVMTAVCVPRSLTVTPDELTL